MRPYLYEFLGTMMMIILGDGAVSNSGLNWSGMKNAGSLQITFAWGFAVMVPAFIFGAGSGAFFNPALTLALAVDGTISWSIVPGYILAQFLGAMAGAFIVWVMFKDHFEATEDSEVILGCFCTIPGEKNIPRNMFCEAVATFILVFAIKGISQVPVMAGGLGNVYTCVIICSIGMSLGGLTGYALNPARDLGPRLIHQLLPIQGKGSSRWDYAVVPLIGPVAGAVCGSLLYKLIF